VRESHEEQRSAQSRMMPATRSAIAGAWSSWDAMHAEDRLAVSGLTHEAGHTGGGEGAARGTMIRDDVSARHQPAVPPAPAPTSRLGR